MRFIFIQGENQLAATFELQETKIFKHFHAARRSFGGKVDPFYPSQQQD